MQEPLPSTLMTDLVESESSRRFQFIALCNSLSQGYADLASKPGLGGPVYAYLLLDRWEEAELAEDFTSHFPIEASQRIPVPDTHYKGREDSAPCLVPMPGAMLPAPSGTASLAEAKARDQLARWLERTWQQSQKRLVNIPLCAILLSDQPITKIAHHFALLGVQKPPTGGPPRLFRYQDPRVMQRVWPRLSPDQQRRWLGPVSQWWAIVQPWGAMDLGQLIGDDLANAENPRWFRAHASDTGGTTTTGHGIHQLFQKEQWQCAHGTSAGNLVWQRFAMDGIRLEEQLDGRQMNSLLDVGNALGLESRDLKDFVWFSWRYRGEAPAVDWRNEKWKPILDGVLARIRNDPNTGFSDALRAQLSD